MIHRLVRPIFKDTVSENIWLTIYGDLITNLLLLFLALYSLTIMGDQAMGDAILAMSKHKDVVARALKSKDAIADTADLLRTRFRFDPNINVTKEAGVVRIELGEQVLFESGLAVPKEKARPIIADVAGLLKNLPYTVVVEGHTDSIPLKSSKRFQNNWELSLARAMAIVRLLGEDGSLLPTQLAAAAYGPYRPRASNLTQNGRRLNRRVEIALFKNFPYSVSAHGH